MVSMEPMVIYREKIRYPKNATPSCFTSALAARVAPKTPILISQEVATASQKNEKAPNAVVPKVLLRFESLIHANNCAKAPKNIAQGTTYERPEVKPSFCDDATRVTIASPNNPNADGSALIILMF